MYKNKWRPSQSKAREFAGKMTEIEKFCRENGISASATKDSYYFSLGGKNYRVSNHSVEASNAHAYAVDGIKMRELYHENGREADVVYIHAGKTRIQEIYTNLLAGYELDGRGNIKN